MEMLKRNEVIEVAGLSIVEWVEMEHCSATSRCYFGSTEEIEWAASVENNIGRLTIRYVTDTCPITDDDGHDTDCQSWIDSIDWKESIAGYYWELF